MSLKSVLKRALTILTTIEWDAGVTISEPEKQVVRKLLTDGYYIILTRHNNYFSTYIISLASLFLRGKFGYWAHVLMNVENAVNSDADFRIVQATGKYGVAYAGFNDTFHVNSVAVLKPKHMTIDHWNKVIERAAGEVGKPYDMLVQLNDDKALNCVELVRDALRAEPNYEKDFANFEAMIKKSYNLSPQMFYECPDFEVVYEVRH